MKSLLLSVAAALSLSVPALSVAVWGQCGVSCAFVRASLFVDEYTGYQLHRKYNL